MSSKLDYSNLSSFEHAVLVTYINKCIFAASKCNGKVFGGFVRDVIVPRLYNPECQMTFKDVDIWFTCQSDADAFVSLMGSCFRKFDGVSVTEGVYPGSFSRNQYHLIKFDTRLAWFDIVVSPNLPVNDFDVNEVTYTLESDDKWVTTASSRLIEQIRNKHAVMLPSYQAMIDKLDHKVSSSKDSPYCKLYYQERIKRIFTSKGWKVTVPTVLSENYSLTL